MIKILSQDVVNQIAAGEVVERPASVLKELIENSIDAGATDIKVYIEEFGTKKIHIIDNGSGIEQADLEKVFIKHATSKITSIDDLDSIISFGFRGEALASIASVSRIILATRNQVDEYGIEIHVERGIITKSKPSAQSKGTDLQVLHLFENIPARKKFLKSKSTENKALMEVLYKFALANPHINFYINIDGSTRNYTAESGLDRCAAILKIDQSLLIPLYYDGKIKIGGYAIHPKHFLKSKATQFMFVNGRSVTDKTIHKAIVDGYDTFLMKNQFPGYVIFLEMPGTEVDVNVHPRKTEVRFSIPSEVYRSVRTSVNTNLVNHLRKETLDKIKTPNFTSATSYPTFLTQSKETFYDTHPEDTKSNIGGEVTAHSIENTLSTGAVREFENFLHTSTDEIRPPPSQKHLTPSPSTSHALLFSEELIKEPEENNSEFRLDFENATQLLNAYILTSNNDSVLVIDQHAASERYFYEKYLAQLRQQKVTSKLMLFPTVISLDSTDLKLVENNSAVFEALGFKLEIFGTDEIRITEVPEFVKMENFEKIFMRILEDVLEHEEISNVTDKIYHETAAILACHTAVRFGDKLTKPEIIQLLKNLSTCEDPYNCPHGRPVIQDWSRYEIEKKFKRCGL